MPFFSLRSFMNSCAARSAPTPSGRTGWPFFKHASDARYSGGFTAALQSGIGAIEGGMDAGEAG